LVYPLVLVSILCYRVQTQEETATHYYFMEITGLVWVREVEWRDKRVTPFLTSGRRDFFHSLHPLYTCKIFFMLPFPGIFNIIISWDLFAPKGKPPNKRYKRLYNSGISLSLSDNPLHRGTISCYPCTLGEGSLVIILEHKRRPAAIKMKENQRKLYVSLVGPYAAKMLPFIPILIKILNNCCVKVHSQDPAKEATTLLLPSATALT